MSFVEPNIAPEKWWLGNYRTFLLGNPIFQVLLMIVFWEGNIYHQTWDVEVWSVLATLAILDVTMFLFDSFWKGEWGEVTLLQGSCSNFVCGKMPPKKDHLKRRGFGKHHGFRKLFLWSFFMGDMGDIANPESWPADVRCFAKKSPWGHHSAFGDSPLTGWYWRWLAWISNDTQDTYVTCVFNIIGMHCFIIILYDTYTYFLHCYRLKMHTLYKDYIEYKVFTWIFSGSSEWQVISHGWRSEFLV